MNGPGCTCDRCQEKRRLHALRAHYERELWLHWDREARRRFRNERARRERERQRARWAA